MSGNKFQSIDLKLKAALAKIAHGDLGRQLTQATEDEAKRGRPLKGRQALLLIYRYFEINEEAGVIYSITDLMAVRWLGDEKIETFLNSWIAVLSGMREEPPLRVKEELFLEQCGSHRCCGKKWPITTGWKKETRIKRMISW